jgi:circadian clock protein KaiC
LKRDGVTVVNTSMMEGVSTDEATTAGISTVADTWIHLSYVVRDGERNRALTIVESRGGGHSHQVRELTLSDEGVDLSDVVVAQGKVLMGVARRVWEQAEHANRGRTEASLALKLLQLKVAQAEAAARLQVVQTEMEARKAEITALTLAAEEASELLVKDNAALHEMRHEGEVTRASRNRAGRAQRRSPRP